MSEQPETRIAVPPSVRFPDGWAAASELGAGDEVITSHGSPAEVIARNDSPTGSQQTEAPVVAYSSDAIEAQLVFLGRSHQMTSSDPENKATHYSRSAGMIRQLLDLNGENS